MRVGMNPGKPLAIDLCAGAGGLSLGLERAGFRTVLAVEKDCHATQTYKRNHPNVDLIQADLRRIDPSACLQRIGLAPGELHILVGGLPCQGFSESNRRTRTVDNPANHLYKFFVKFLREMLPEWFVIENVAGLRTLSGGILLKHIVSSCERLGFVVKWRELNSVDFGVPQRRRRLFVVGNRHGLPIDFPIPSCGPGKSPYITVRDAISDLPRLKNGASIDYVPYRFKSPKTSYQNRMHLPKHLKVVQGNLVTRNAEHILDRYRHIRPGDNWEAIPRRLLRNYEAPERCHTGIYYRLEWNKAARVIGNFRKNMLIHPSQNRGLSIREAARLQSFPDSYIFLGSIGFQQQQVADAVPPLLAEKIAAVILKSMRPENEPKLDTTMEFPVCLAGEA